MRSWTTFLLFSGLILLLVVLGGLQYRWQTQISESQGEKLRKTVQEDASRFAEDFNKEIQSAYFNFQVSADDWRAKNYHPFVERYDFWLGKTAYPELISDFYFFDFSGNEKPLKFDKQTKTFSTIEWTPELHELFTRASNEKEFHAVYEDAYTLILPEHEAPPQLPRVVIRRSSPSEADARTRIPEPMQIPKVYGFLAIRLDPSVIKEKMLPDLSAKYFGDGDFNVAVTDKNGQQVFQSGNTVNSGDVQADLFELSPNDIFFFANRDLVNTLGERRESVVMNSRVESRTMTTASSNGNESGTVKVEIHRGDTPKTQIFTTGLRDSGDHWTVAAQHTSGSIDAFIANTRTRNLAAGYGILALLGLAVAAIIYSAQRAKSFARRQIDFVSSVSHEFRTPLAVIYSAGENLADGVANNAAQTSKYGELIKGEGRKLSAMVEQILEFAGASSGRQKYNFRRTTVSEVIENAVRECRQLVDQEQVDVETDVDEDLPAINADEDALSRAIQNLIANSVKYRNGHSWMRISAHRRNGGVEIKVEDRGIGISSTELRQIFEPFYRSKDVVDAQIHGNGLGLALVKQIVEAHAGRIFVESEPGKGSVFTIELPADR